MFERLKSFMATRVLKSSMGRDDNVRKMLDFLGVDSNMNKDAVSEATYFSCLKVLSESVGKLPLNILQYKRNGGVETIRNHDLYTTIHDRPNPYQSASVFWSQAENLRNEYGNCFILIETKKNDRKLKTNLWILDNSGVEVYYDNAKLVKDVPDIYYKYSTPNGVVVFSSEEIIHLRTWKLEADGILGMPVRHILKTTINAGLSSQNLVNKMADSGFTAKAVLQYTGDLSDENTKAFVQGIEKYMNGGLKENGVENIIPIPLGSTLTPFTTKLADNEFIALRQYTSMQIASAFGIKPYQIGDYTKSSYASAEAQQLSFYVDTLLYIVKQYEEELTYKLLTDEEIEQGLHFKFNVGVMLRADQKTQIETLSTAVNSFLYTPNEARAMLDLESVDGGDKLLGNGTSIPVEYTGIQYTQANSLSELEI